MGIQSINNIRANLGLGGARPNQFQVILTPPPGLVTVGAVALVKVPFLVQASSIPINQVDVAKVPYFGRSIYLKGDRPAFAPWTITVINDEDFLIRDYLESWLNNLNTMIGNTLNFASSDPSTYKASAILQQISQTGIPIREYFMDGLLITNVSPMVLNWEDNNKVETFEATFVMDDFQVFGPTGVAGTGGN